jgi:hypothetical protein
LLLQNRLDSLRRLRDFAGQLFPCPVRSRSSWIAAGGTKLGRRVHTPTSPQASSRRSRHSCVQAPSSHALHSRGSAQNVSRECARQVSNSRQSLPSLHACISQSPASPRAQAVRASLLEIDAPHALPFLFMTDKAKAGHHLHLVHVDIRTSFRSHAARSRPVSLEGIRLLCDQPSCQRVGRAR